MASTIGRLLHEKPKFGFASVKVYDPRDDWPIGLGGLPVPPEHETPAGYHISGRYMPLQGGSNTRRQKTGYIAWAGSIDGKQKPGMSPIRESLSAYFDRISR